jgi:hypothetical protein
MNTVIAFVALAAMALVGLDLALRPGKHVASSADRVRRGRGIPLEALSHRFFPRLENAAAYRVTGLVIVAFAAALAVMVIAR